MTVMPGMAIMISGTATPDKLDTDITVSTQGAPAVYYFSFSPASGWTWYGDQSVSVGLSASVTIVTQWLAGMIVVPVGVTDWFESEYYGNLTPTGTGGGPGPLSSNHGTLMPGTIPST